MVYIFAKHGEQCMQYICDDCRKQNTDDCEICYRNMRFFRRKDITDKFQQETHDTVKL